MVLICIHDTSKKKINYDMEHYMNGVSNSMWNDHEDIRKMAEQNLKLLERI